jgi:hypothetical protein
VVVSVHGREPAVVEFSNGSHRYYFAHRRAYQLAARTGLARRDHSFVGRPPKVGRIFMA